MDNLISVLENNYKVILDEYLNFCKIESKYFKFKDIVDDNSYKQWREECSHPDITPIKKYDYWYGYMQNNEITWETILIAHIGKKYIHPTEYGKLYFLKTYNLLKKFNIIKRVTVSKLKTNGSIPLHVGYSDTKKIHLGLQVPDGDIAFKVNNNILKWQEGRCFCFNDSDPHMAWNNTEYDRIVLIVDVNE